MDEDFCQEYLLMVVIERRLLWRLGFGCSAQVIHSNVGMGFRE